MPLMQSPFLLVMGVFLGKVPLELTTNPSALMYQPQPPLLLTILQVPVPALRAARTVLQWGVHDNLGVQSDRRLLCTAAGPQTPALPQSKSGLVKISIMPNKYSHVKAVIQIVVNEALHYKPAGGKVALMAAVISGDDEGSNASSSSQLVEFSVTAPVRKRRKTTLHLFLRLQQSPVTSGSPQPLRWHPFYIMGRSVVRSSSAAVDEYKGEREEVHMCTFALLLTPNGLVHPLRTDSWYQRQHVNRDMTIELVVQDHQCKPHLKSAVGTCAVFNRGRGRQGCKIVLIGSTAGSHYQQEYEVDSELNQLIPTN
ncbi:uncharacterized protein EDB91DRAFT_1088184 [Suillus paluster]|uniref:uncharacterized protein n=1 Tax=Suillus paluster TaxID=48578 RepID=UPI001B873802|nr:uncharacterized protein EDB91DRAFT_1088184 [Suillus paluster]KAG1722328.1 hypothetical protein EDB91DRAFT_1088184 [Suillus paluster]